MLPLLRVTFSGRKLVQCLPPPILESQLGRQNIRGTYETCNEPTVRPFINLVRPTHLDDAAFIEDGEAVRHGEGFALIMGDEDEGNAHFLLQRLEFFLHLLAELEIEGAQRFVEQQHLGLIHERTGQGNALALTAGKLPGPAAFKAAELHHRQGLAARDWRAVRSTPRIMRP